MNSLGGPAETITFEITKATDCSSTYDVDINTNSISSSASGIEHDVTALSSTTTRAVIDGQAAALRRYINVDLSNMDDCTEFDLLICADYPGVH